MLSTYSIAACDLERREWGVAVASKFLAVGALVAWAEPEVGAIATQAWIKTSYATEGLALLRSGLSAQEVLDRLVDEDDGRDRRQVGIVDDQGRGAAYTGAGCPDWAGGRTGSAYAIQGNILASEDVITAMAEAFEAAPERPLAERLLETLAVGDAAGGDRRGKQAAALYVVKRGGGYEGSDILIDLRVDDHPDPVAELRRLHGLHDLYFGETPQHEWLQADDALRAEVKDRLRRLGYASGNLSHDLETWAGIENLEERVRGVERLDPVVLDELRKR